MVLIWLSKIDRNSVISAPDCDGLICRTKVVACIHSVVDAVGDQQDEGNIQAVFPVLWHQGVDQWVRIGLRTCLFRQ